MLKLFALAIATVALAACNTTAKPRLVSEKAAAPAPAPAKVSRTEPIFYNGKTYQLSIASAGEGYDLSVSGMTPKQEKDAVAVATSSLRYFACKDTQTSKVTRSPSYDGAKWKLAARCV